MSTQEMAGEPEQPVSLEECQVALSAARQEIAELRDKYLRAAATIENTRKQAERNAALRMTERLRAFHGQLLEVLDNLERALAHASEGDPLSSGVQATLQQLRMFLDREGVTPVPAHPGAPFDPRYHEAIEVRESNDTSQAQIEQVVQTGYTFAGQLLRPARVVVTRPLRSDTQLLPEE